MAIFPRPHELRPLVHSIARAGRSAVASGQIAAQAGLGGGGSVTEGVGTIDMRAVVRVLPREIVESLLPAGLQLAPQPLVPPGRHPVFVLFSHDRFEAWFGDMDYHEVMIGVPYVELVDAQAKHRGPFVYMPRLYLDHTTPRVLGNVIYGFEKVAGVIELDDDAGTVRATDPASGLELASLAWTPTGDWQSPDALANFAFVRRIFEMPTISQAQRIFDEHAFDDRDDPPIFLATNVTYGLADPSARVQPIRAQMRIGETVTPHGLPTDVFACEGLDSAVLGAFRLQAPQIVSLPGSCAGTRYPSVPARRERVLVLGGGPAACAAAYWLARQTDRFQVTLATQGFRLGGKCAASRNPDADMRIEEHGLHAFMGFYENAFRTVREVYATAELPIARSDGPVAGAFLGQRNLGLMARWDERNWRHFETPSRPNADAPGLVPEGGDDEGPGYGAAIQALLQKIRTDFDELVQSRDERRDAVESALAQRSLEFFRKAVEDLGDVAREAALGIHSVLVRLVDEVQAMTRDTVVTAIGRGDPSLRLLRRALVEVRSVLRWYFADRADEDPQAWFTWGGLDSVLTIAIGILRDRVVDLSTLDDRDLLEWLWEHGLDRTQGIPVAIEQVYETLFAHADDVPIRAGNLAAGVGLRWFLLVFFARKGFYAYDFRWSTGETLMTPYLHALQRLGADVRFFHRVVEIVVEGDGDDRRLAGVRVQVQAQTLDGRPYAPLVDPPRPGQPACWPMRPRYEQLVHGESFEVAGTTFEDAYERWPSEVPPPPVVELRQGDDFDWCVLGVPLGALPTVVRPLVEPSSPTHSAAWQAMVDGIGLVQTTSAQLWFTRSPEEMFAQPRGLLTCYAQPQPSLGHLSHLIEWEGWGGDPPKCLAYLTGARAGRTVLPPTYEHEYHRDVLAAWREEFREWLVAHWRGLFDRAPAQWEALLDALAVPSKHADARGLDRLWAQHFTVASQPSDLYVLSRPGETKLRMGATESGVRFLLLCGDWTKTDLNCGCVEAATQSGMLAARALAGEPVYVWRPGF